MTKNRDDRVTKLHLLKAASSKAPLITESPSSLKDALEEKVERIERELKSSIGILQAQLHTTLQQAGLSREEGRFKKELARLTGLLEQRIQSVGESGTSKAAPLEKPSSLIPPPKAGTLKKLSYYLNRLISLKTYRRFLFGVTRIEKEDFDEFGRDPAFEKKVKPIFDFLYYKYWRVSVDGLENIPIKVGRSSLPTILAPFPSTGR